MRAIRAMGLTAAGLVLVLAGCELGGGGDGGPCLAVAHPAERTLPPQVKTMAVMAFSPANTESRQYAVMAADTLASRLTESIGPMGAGRCQIVERNNLKDLLKEMDLGDAGITDAATAAKAGKMANADTVVMGSIQVQTPPDVRGSKTEPTIDMRTQQPTTKIVRTIRRTASVGINFKMVSVESATVLFSKATSYNYDSGEINEQASMFGSGGSGSLKTQDAAARELVNRCIADFCRMIAAHVEIRLIPMAGGRSDRAKAGVALARTGDWAEAAKAFEEATQLKPEDHGSFYNLGVCRMFQNDTAGAKKAIDAAVRMKADKKYMKTRSILMRAIESGGVVQLRPATERERSESGVSSKRD